jgi:hypothetical protein
MELTPEQLEAYLKDELEMGEVSSAMNPDGIFESIEQKRNIIEYLQKKNNVFNQ